jgi:hypothetical protein
VMAYAGVIDRTSEAAVLAWLVAAMRRLLG